MIYKASNLLKPTDRLNYYYNSCLEEYLNAIKGNDEW